MTSQLPSRPEAVLFDFDHTLADLGTYVRWDDARGELLALYEAAGVPRAFLEETPGALGLYVRVAASALVPQERLEAVQPIASEIIERVEIEAIPRTKLLQGARACLDGLRSLGLRAGVVSSNSIRVVRAILEREGLDGVFEAVICRDDARELKPSPEGLLACCAAIHVSPEHCIFVGDSRADIEAARAAGMVAYGVTGGVSSIEELREAGALEVMDSLERLCDLVVTAALSEVR